MCLEYFRYADIVDVGDSVLIENQNKMMPAKVDYISVHTKEGIHNANFKIIYNEAI